MSSENNLTKWDQFIDSIDKQISLRDVLEAFKSYSDLGDPDRYQPWYFLECLSQEDVHKIDELIYEDEEDEL